MSRYAPPPAPLVAWDVTAKFGGDLQKAVTAVAEAGLGAGVELVVRPGTLTVPAPLTGIPRALHIRGHGRRQSILSFPDTSAATLFNLGTFNAAPASYFEGTVPEFTLRDLQIDGPAAHIGLGAGEGARTLTCIQDNGNGSILLDGVEIRGCKRGLWAAYGSDFTTVARTLIEYCDVGAYFGPWCEQVDIDTTMFSGNREALVLDGAPQGDVNAWFLDSLIADVVMEANATNRAGVTAPNNAAHRTSWDFRSSWFESNAFGTDRRPPRHIYVTGTLGATYPRGLRLHSPHLVSGGTDHASNAFLEITAGLEVRIEDLRLYGDSIKYVVKRAGAPTTARVIQRNTRLDEGGTNTVLWDSKVDSIEVDDYTGKRNDDGVSAVLATWGETASTGRWEMANAGSPTTRRVLRAYSGAALAATFDPGAVSPVALESGKCLRPGQTTTAGRPSAVNAGEGAMSYDTTLDKPIWSDGAVWRDATGTAV